MNQAELAQFEQSFEQVIVDLNDGNQLLMFKCVKCTYICRCNSNTRLAHWKRCPSKFSFKYVNQNQSVGGTITECMKCHLRLLSPPLFDMKMHSERCPMKWQSNPAQTMNSPFASTNFSVNSNNQLNGKSNSVACVYYETMVNQKEIDAQRKASTVKNSCSVWVTRNGFKRKYIQGSNGPEQHHECQTCKLLIRKPTMHSLQSHRVCCANNSQLNVPPLQTVPQTHTMAQRTMLPYTTTSPQSQQSHSSISSPLNGNYGHEESNSHMQLGLHWLLGESPKLCFVCNTSSSESFVNLFGTVTKHTNTKIIDYIEQFQKNVSFGRNASIDGLTTNWNYVCADCLETINAFDLTCMTAAKLEFKLREKLSYTEELYAKRQRSGTVLQNIDKNAQELPLNEYSVQDDIINLDSPPAIQEQETELQQDEQKVNDEDECEKVHYLVELSDGEES